MTCKIHNIEYEGRCTPCRRVAARRGYYTRRGVPVPDFMDECWQPGASCSVCGKPILTEQDKHPRTCTHRNCGDPHSNVWRPMDPCQKCGLPVVSIATKHRRFKSHAACIDKQIEETERKARGKRATYNRAIRTKSRHMKAMFVGKPEAKPPQAEMVIVGDVKPRVIPSVLKATLRDPVTGTFWESI